MSLASNIKAARLAKGYNQEKLAILIGKTKNVISNWERGDNKPDADSIFLLGKALDVDLNYLLDWESPNYSKISVSEQNLIKKYRDLDYAGKKLINSVIDIEHERCLTVDEPETAYLTQPYYSLGASAGNGNYLFDDMVKTTIAIPDTTLNRKADFILDVRGDSMEPTYSNDDKVLIVTQSQLNFGDIGIFIVNGESYIKEYSKNGLVSHNKKYPLITINEYDSFKIVGKVIGKL